jgi:hypothetical protein
MYFLNTDLLQGQIYFRDGGKLETRKTPLLAGFFLVHPKGFEPLAF